MCLFAYLLMSRIMALDVGEKRIGISMSDELELTAQGLLVLTRQGLEKDLMKIREIIEKYLPGEIVVGIPFNMDGTVGESARKMLDFVNFLKGELKIPVKTWDERLTTVSSEKVLLEADISRRKRKRVVDKIAATLLLQGYLDSKKGDRLLFPIRKDKFPL